VHYSTLPCEAVEEEEAEEEAAEEEEAEEEEVEGHHQPNKPFNP